MLEAYFIKLNKLLQGGFAEGSFGKQRTDRLRATNRRLIIHFYVYVHNRPNNS